LVLRRLIPFAFRPVLANRVFRRLILGFAVSYLGDGMSFVAVPARRLLLADSVVRGVFLGAVPLASLAGLLTLPLYVVLVAVSSLLGPIRNREARSPSRP
jgi:hypothetical protein